MMIENESSSGGAGNKTTGMFAVENNKDNNRGGEAGLFPDATSHPNDWCLSPLESQSISDSVSLDSTSASLTPRSKFLKAKLAELREQRLRDLVGRSQQNLPPAQSEFVKNKIIAELHKIKSTKQQEPDRIQCEKKEEPEKVETPPIDHSSEKPADQKNDEAADSDIESFEEASKHSCSPRSCGATEPTEETTDHVEEECRGPEAQEEEKLNNGLEPEMVIQKDVDMHEKPREANISTAAQKVSTQQAAERVASGHQQQPFHAVAAQTLEGLDLVPEESSERPEVIEEVSEETDDDTTDVGVKDLPPRDNEKPPINKYEEQVIEECDKEAEETKTQPRESYEEIEKDHIEKEKDRSRSRSTSRDGSRGHHSSRRHEGGKNRGRESKRDKAKTGRESFNKKDHREHRQDSRSPDGRDRDRDRDSSPRPQKDNRSRRSSRRESSRRSPNRRRGSSRERRRSSTRNKHESNKHKSSSKLDYNPEEDQTMRRGSRRNRHSMSALHYEPAIEESPRRRTSKNECLAQLLFHEDGGEPIQRNSHRYHNHMSLRNNSPPELIGYQHDIHHDQLQQNDNDLFLPVFHHAHSTNEGSGGNFVHHGSHQDTPELWTRTPQEDSPHATSAPTEDITPGSILPPSNTSSTHVAAVAAAAAAAEAAAEAAQRAGAALVAIKRAEAHQRDSNLSVAMAAAASASAAAATAAAAVTASLQQYHEEPESQQSGTLRSTREALSATVAASTMNLFHPPPPPVQTFYGNF